MHEVYKKNFFPLSNVAYIVKENFFANANNILTRFRRQETMAEIAVTLLIDKLVQLLVQEAKLLNCVHREVVGISDELESIMCFPKDVNARAEKGGDLQDGMKVWVKRGRQPFILKMF
jgi:hypothetical protein